MKPQNLESSTFSGEYLHDELGVIINRLNGYDVQEHHKGYAFIVSMRTMQLEMFISYPVEQQGFRVIARRFDNKELQLFDVYCDRAQDIIPLILRELAQLSSSIPLYLSEVANNNAYAILMGVCPWLEEVPCAES